MADETTPDVRTVIAMFDSMLCQLAGEYGCAEAIKRLWAEDDNLEMFELQNLMRQNSYEPSFLKY